MGGIPPLGYKPDGRSLAIVEEHARVIRHIYQRNLALKNVRLLEQDLIATGVTAPSRSTATGKPIGGRPFSRGQLYLMLKCVTYTGQRAPWRDLSGPGSRHHRWRHLRAGRASNPSLLAGKIVGPDDEPLIATHATKGSAIAAALHAKQDPAAPATITTAVEARLTRSGRVLRLVQDGASGDERTSLSLTKLLAHAHRWCKELRLGQISLTELSGREGVTGSYLTRVLRLAILSPALTQAILAGRQPFEIDVRSLTLTGTEAPRWADQAEAAA